MAARPGSDSRKFSRPRSPINGIWLGVSADSLTGLHPTEYEARTFSGGGGGRLSRVWSCAVMVLGSWSPWGYLEKNKSSFRHGPGGAGAPGGTWRRTKVASVMALGESESLGV